MKLESSIKCNIYKSRFDLIKILLMSLLKLFSFIFLISFISSCTPSVYTNLEQPRFNSLDETTEQLVLTHQSEIQNASFVGTLRSKKSGILANCGYDRTLEDAKDAARKSGANILQIKELKKPKGLNPCYDLSADLYRNLDEEGIAEIKEIQIPTSSGVNKDRAVIHFFRDKILVGSALSYKVRIGDKVLGKIKNGKTMDYEIDKPGKYIFWAKTERKEYVELDVEMGKEYYVQCGLKPGVWVGRPTLTQIENHVIDTYFDLSKP